MIFLIPQRNKTISDLNKQTKQKSLDPLKLHQKEQNEAKLFLSSNKIQKKFVKLLEPLENKLNENQTETKEVMRTGQSKEIQLT